jgi:putative peptidoglycan lipid II flippase
MRYAGFSLTANTIGSLALFLLFRDIGIMPHLGIAVATTLGGWLNAWLLARALVRQGHFVADARLLRSLPRILAAALLMGAMLWLGADLLQPLLASGRGLLVRAGALAGLVTLGLVSYGLALVALGYGLKALLGRALSRR